MAIAISNQNKEEADDHMFIVIYDFLTSKPTKEKGNKGGDVFYSSR